MSGVEGMREGKETVSCAKPLGERTPDDRDEGTIGE